MTTPIKVHQLLNNISDSIEHWPTHETNVRDYALEIWAASVLPNREYDQLLKEMKTDFWGLLYPIFYAHKALKQTELSLDDKHLWQDLIKVTSPEYAVRAMQWVQSKVPNMETHQILATLIRESNKWKRNSSISSGKGFQEYCQDYIAFGEFLVPISNQKTREGKPWSKDFLTWTSKQTDLYSDSILAEAPKYLPGLLIKSTLPDTWKLRLYKQLAPRFWLENTVSYATKPLINRYEHLLQRLDTLPWSSHSELNRHLISIYLPEIYEFISMALSENEWVVKNNIRTYTALFSKKI